jgi:hypothetical protein
VSQKKEENMQNLLKSPEMVQTIPELKRSEDLPSHKTKSLAEIEDEYEHNKEMAVINQLKLAEEEIVKNRNAIKSKSFSLVTDLTEQLTKDAKSHIQNHNEQNTDQEIRKRKMKIMIKKTYNWLIGTMEQTGEYIDYNDHQYLACDLKDIRRIAEESSINYQKVSFEISKGLKNGLFIKINNKLISVDE